ncbi:MAG TPA: site-2 protease family protein [Candidatus Obscuribacterales bacterium]
MTDKNKSSGAKTKGALAALGALALNFKAFGALLLKGGWLVKFSWILKSGATMFIALWVYTMTYGWGFAVMLVALLLIHEMGHWVWIKANNIDSSAPIFIPFVGAVIMMKQLPPDEATNAWVALAGPLVGGAGALAFWLLGLLTNNSLLMAGGSFGFFLNLFQLVPARPLDGGWVLGAINRWLLIPGTAIIVVLALLTHSPLLIIISAISIMSLLRKQQKQPVAAVQAVRTVGEYERELNAAGTAAVLSGNGGAGGSSAGNGGGAGSPNTASDTEQTNAQAQAQQQSQTQTAPPVEGTMRPATAKQRWAIGLAYLSLAGFLGFMHMHSIHVMYDRIGTNSPVRYMINKYRDSDKAADSDKTSDDKKDSDDDK